MGDYLIAMTYLFIRGLLFLPTTINVVMMRQSKNNDKCISLTENMSDEELLQRWVNDDKQAFNLFYMRHSMWIRKIVLKKISWFQEEKTETETDDWTQDIWLKICLDRAKIKVDEQGSARPFLATYIARKIINCYRDVLAKSLDFVPLENNYEADRAESKDAKVESIIAKKEILKVIHNILDKYPDLVQQSFIERKFKGLSAKEVGRILNLSPRTIDNNISMVLAELRLQLGDAVIGALIGLYGSNWLEHLMNGL